MLVIEQAKILTNQQIASGIWRMSMHAPQIAGNYKGPGQFINLLSSNQWTNLIRRPMSIAAVHGEYVDIIYKIFGDVSYDFSQKSPGQFMNILGPLGNVFTEYDRDDIDQILIGGGVGLAPMLNLFEQCKNPQLIIGARTAAEHFLKPKNNDPIILTTDDGSLGLKGNVIHALEKLKLNSHSIIYSCGPLPMLKAVQNYALKYGIKAQLSVESYMACGIGLCQGCVIHRNTQTNKLHSYHEKYSLVCMEGPVYDSQEVSFD